MNLHTPKWTPMFGVRVPNGLPNLQNVIAGVKTRPLKEFFYIIGKILKRRCLKWARSSFGHLKNKLWPKERLGVKLIVWLLTIISRISTRFPCMQAMCDILLESSRWGLQLCYRPHCNRRSAQEVMRLQSPESPNCCNFGTPTWESWDKKSFGCGPRGEAQSIL
jgi:hypothetical protein